MCSRFCYLTCLVALVQINAFQNTAGFPHGKVNQMQTRLLFSPPMDGATDTTELQSSAIQNLPVQDAALNILLENMPVAEKYSLLLQSYATNIIDSTNRTVAALDTMESLFTEMLSKSIAPSDKSSKLLIDASSTFCSSIKLGKSLQLAKAGGTCKAFGAANGQLSIPVTAASMSTLSDASLVPYDDREQEVLYAGLVAGISTLWISLQVSQTFVSELHLWTTLLGVGAIGLCALDVAIRQGSGIKLASAGLERLVLKDAERETHSDGAAFLVGYLLGLPCFCFRPDVTEALKMLRDDPQGLSFYRQPKADGLTAAGKGGRVSVSKKDEGNPFQSIFGKKLTVTKKDAVNMVEEKVRIQPFNLPEIPISRGKMSESGYEEIQDLSRVLVWLMAPVAAEYLKYGKTIVSDPRRSVRLLSVLEKVQASEGGPGGVSGVMGGSGGGCVLTVEDVMYRIPLDEEDKKVFLQWAFFEATSLIRQYGDLLEDVNSYLATGTSTVGECVLLVEEELK